METKVRLGQWFPPCLEDVGHDLCNTNENISIHFKLDFVDLIAIHYLFMYRIHSMGQIISSIFISILIILFC